MKSNTLSSKCCSLLLVLVLLLTPIAPVIATGETLVSLVPALMTGNEVSLTMQVDSTWEGYFNGTITVTNTGEKQIENWALSFEFPHSITSIWDGVIFEQADGMYTVKNAGWNQDIPVGGSVSFGFTAQQNGEAFTPEFYFINTAQQSVPSTDYEATYKLKKDWGTGFSGVITLENTSSQIIEDWSFSMDFARTITTASNTIFTQGEGTQYLLTNPGYGQNINSGKSIKFSIQGTGGVETDVPSNFLVSQVTIGVSLTGDYDADGVKDYEELLIYGTDPLVDDTNTEPDPDLVTDTDGDGIPDYYETGIGTDPNLADTDGDGIDDMTEWSFGMDPLVSDLDLDFDEDGLTLRQEQDLGSEFWNEDTDYDGLLDGDEVNNYGTDPLIEDTDFDGLVDGDEIALGLDPLSSATHGVPDSEYTQTHVFSSDSDIFSEINIEDAPYTLSAEITASGNVPEYLVVSESSYSAAVENEAILGAVAELEYDDNNIIEEVKLMFQIQDEFIPNTESDYASVNPEFKGIKRYNVFRYFKDINMLLPVETYFDEENQIAYAVTDLVGTYCLIDMEKWLDSIGVLPMDIAVETEVCATPTSLEAVGAPDASLLSLKSESTLWSQISSGVLFSANQVRSERFNGHRYAVIDKGDMSWPDAKVYCEFMGGHLVTITSETEQEFINDMLYYGQMNLYWIGAYRDGTAFRWITGEEFEYSNWDVGEPNYAIENCVHMYRNSWLTSELGTWNDTYEYLGGTAFHSTINAGLVCEWETPVAVLYGSSLVPCNRAAELSNLADTDWDDDEIPNWQEISIDADLGYWNIDGKYIPAMYDDYIIAKYIELGSDHPFGRLSLNPIIIPIIPTTSNPENKDSDYDGLIDSTDNDPNSNAQVGTLKQTNRSAEVSYRMDYRVFFGDSTVYSKKLSVASSLFAANAYHDYSFIEEESADNMDIQDVMAYHGMEDVTIYDLSKMSYTDNHLSEATIGHREVTYMGQTKEIICVVIRGTNGTIQEWSSNFDLGTATNYSSDGYDDWIIESNHMGFDIAATRILRCVNSYIATYIDDEADKVFWVTGHSRGAAIANIVGARMIDKGYETFDYTFAAPATTTSTNAGNYGSIFNIINTDDFVTKFPLEKWGFTRYGVTKTISVVKKLEKKWEKLVDGVGDYNASILTMGATLDAMKAIADDRDDCYEYTCTCHKNGISSNADNITITNYGVSKTSREAAINKIPSNALPFCMVTRHDGGALGGWDFDVCQTPEYFMQILAATSAKIGDHLEWYEFIAIDVAERYQSTKFNVSQSKVFGIEHPHYAETYYCIASN